MRERAKGAEKAAIALSALLSCALVGALASTTRKTAASEGRACARGAVDLHVDLPFQVLYRGRSPSLRARESRVHAAALRRGGVGVLVLSIYLSSRQPVAEHTYGAMMRSLEAAERIVAATPALFAEGGPVVPVYGVEGAQGLAGHFDRIPALVARGVVLYAPTHVHHNALADSSGDDAPGRGGLTEDGERFVQTVYGAGALVDVSHLSDEAFDDVARIAERVGKPLVATHSNARAIADHPRNLTDAQLRAIGRSGGVVGLNFHSTFLRDDRRRATLDDVLRHLRRVIETAGPEAVAVGSDLDGVIRPARGLGSHAGLCLLRRAILRDGFSEARAHAFLGGNARRVLSAVDPRVRTAFQ